MTLISSAKNPVATLLLAHGAGAPMDSPFMESLAAALADRGIQVVRFEFPYMQRRREEQRKFPPNRAPQLLEAFARQVASVERSGLPLWVGGKSMGGRMASMLAAEGASEIDGVVAFGYPFHPPGKPENTRTEHLASLAVPMLICQGERDPFGKPEEVKGYSLDEGIRVQWLEGGDHDFKPLKRSGRTQQQLIEEAASRVLAFMQRESEA
ncbi:MAG: alpha/beta hydrolase [Alcanivoracaceae bacterium]|uniref:alpha/beta family hydrolase n=1 Tax=Alcanivorax sp. MD8A TaxID=1177157 RepID=UPI000C601FB5|nr:alpha/beta family hydrolase [Alcanivorax sp. MD8A]MAX54774.1 alpha/beta hydrolase [Alcanivoracaceae bacterium]MCG8436809.1 alpha/beta fold hydrolase [Pseudomonadales bacterium]MEE2871109.1 alpha/beta family hydrolase [Pseudomonadota bacterium]PNE02878.1 alpha/beta hydrolase [Alcanivorax sp. MD8A]